MRVTLKDIARLANISKATVSRVNNGATKGVGDETRRRILETMERLDTGPIFWRAGSRRAGRGPSGHPSRRNSNWRRSGVFSSRE